MDALHEFLSGPALYVTFFIFFGGLIIRAAFLLGLSRGKDQVFYDHFSWSWALRSVLAWLLPWGSRSLRTQPLMAIVFFLFHLCLLATPIFLSAHNILWEGWAGWSLPTLPGIVADVMTLVVLGGVVFLFIRRLVRPEVRVISTLWDYLLLLLTAAPFATGILAQYQIGGPYNLMMVLHILSAEVLLIIIPFSKLGHLILFFFTRAFIGVDMGARRNYQGRMGAKVW